MTPDQIAEWQQERKRIIAEMRANPVEVGDVVRLAIDGPDMVVDTVNRESRMTTRPKVFCLWFDTIGRMQERWILEELLHRKSP